jgi:hypothetical protein
MGRNILGDPKLDKYIENRIKIWWESAKVCEYKRNYYTPHDFINSLANHIDININNIEELSKQYKKHEKDISAYIPKFFDFGKSKIAIDEVKRLINEEIKPLKIENEKLKEEINRLRKGQTVQQETRQNVYQNANSYTNDPISSDGIIEKFNEWAKSPQSILPSQFIYTDGELRLREKQNIKDGNNSSLWIKNKSGPKKYIFPNPNVIDQIGGDIDAIYTITGTRKARGQNKVIINKPCEIRDDGWIEYKGSMDLL